MEYIPGGDDEPLVIIRRDLSGGVNTRQDAAIIAENQATILYNVDIGNPGQTSKRPGITLVEDLGNDAGVAAYGFEPQGGTNELVVMHGQKLETWPGSSTFTERKTDFTATSRPAVFMGRESGEGDVLFVGNGTDNWFRMNQSYSFQDLGNTNTSPPRSNVGTYYRSRVWVLASEKLYWSDAADDDYSGAFDRTTNNFNMPVGTEQALVGLRDLGLICFGSRNIYAINPSNVPAATDKAEKLYDQGTLAGGTVVLVGDDIYFLAPDGVRSLVRTQQDKLQLGASYPLSYQLKTEFSNLSTAYVSKAQAVWFDNKYFLAVPTASSTYNNQVWCYYPATGGWTIHTGKNVGAWAKVKISGQERLYYIDANDGSVYRDWYGTSDNSSIINYQEEGREEDLGAPLAKKWGGEIEIVAAPASSEEVHVYANPDSLGWSYLGAIDLGSGAYVTFPTNFPVSFPTINVVRKKFHLDDLGEWYRIKTKLQHNTATARDIVIYERGIITGSSMYQGEE